MDKDELAKILYWLPSDNFTVDTIAEYLLEHYHLIDKKTKCYEGKLLRIEALTDWIGKNCFTDIVLNNRDKHARLFIEEKK